MEAVKTHLKYDVLTWIPTQYVNVAWNNFKELSLSVLDKVAPAKHWGLKRGQIHGFIIKFFLKAFKIGNNVAPDYLKEHLIQQDHNKALRDLSEAKV